MGLLYLLGTQGKSSETEKYFLKKQGPIDETHDDSTFNFNVVRNGNNYISQPTAQLIRHESVRKPNGHSDSGKCPPSSFASYTLGI